MTTTSTDRRAGTYGQAAFKLPCVVATTANITLSGLQTIDGVSVAADDRVLVKNQTDGTENGVYVADTGDWVRASDFDGPRDVVQGTLTLVISGTVNGNTVFQLSTASPVIGTSSLSFAMTSVSALFYATAFIQTLLDDTTAAAARTTLGAVGLTGNETVAGIKAFTGANTHSGDETHSGAETFSGTVTMTGKAINQAQGADIASVAGTADIGAATGNYVKITGTNTITGLGTVQAGTQRRVEFTGALVLTHNATSLILPGGANITTAAGDCADFVSEGSGNWRCLNYQRAAAPGATVYLGADVALNNTANFFNGPSTGSLPPGTYILAAKAVASDSAGAAEITAQIHDGSAAIDTAHAHVDVATRVVALPLFKVLTITVATTFTLQARDATSTSGTLLRSSASATTANLATNISWARLL